MTDYLWFLIVVVALINAAAFAVMGIDKSRSRGDQRRIPEVYLLVWAAFLGSAGVFAGMLVFRHKIRKLYLFASVAIMLLQQSILIYSLI